MENLEDGFECPLACVHRGFIRGVSFHVAAGRIRLGLGPGSGTATPSLNFPDGATARRAFRWPMIDAESVASRTLRRGSRLKSGSAKMIGWLAFCATSARTKSRPVTKKGYRTSRSHRHRSPRARHSTAPARAANRGSSRLFVPVAVGDQGVQNFFARLLEYRR